MKGVLERKGGQEGESGNSDHEREPGKLEREESHRKEPGKRKGSQTKRTRERVRRENQERWPGNTHRKVAKKQD